MKKIIVILCIAFLLTGCNSSQGTDNEYFVRIGKYDANYGDFSIVYAKDTKVMYVVSNESYNRSSFTPLYNADGSLQIYKGDKENK